MKNSGFLQRNAAGIVLLMGCVVFVGLITSPAVLSAKSSARRSSCQSQLRNIMMACLQYQDDYDGKYPPLSDGAARGWSLLLQSHGKTLKFSCPEGYNSSLPSSDYFFNARLAARRSSFIQNPNWMIAFGDGPDNGPSNSHYWELPNDEDNENSPLRRHLWGANYAFADGHIKALNAQSIARWMSNTDGKQEWHYQFAPSESTTRRKPRSQPTINVQQKRLHEQNYAAESLDKKN